MFQQTATPEDLASTAFRPARAGAAPDKAPGATGSPATHDPFLDHYFKRVDPRVAASFTPEQCEAIKSMFGGRGIARHAVEIRRSLPIGRGRYYLVLLLGRERRTFDRLYSEGTVSGAFNLLGYAITAALCMLPALGAALLLQALL
ncbi:MAG TPA: hypothetical protein VIR45_09315 [Kiloniellaceae bacterium]